MAGECDKDGEREEIHQPVKTEKKTEDVVRDENLLEDILVNPNPKTKTHKTDPLAKMLNVSTTYI